MAAIAEVLRRFTSLSKPTISEMVGSFDRIRNFHSGESVASSVASGESPVAPNYSSKDSDESKEEGGVKPFDEVERVVRSSTPNVLCMNGGSECGDLVVEFDSVNLDSESGSFNTDFQSESDDLGSESKNVDFDSVNSGTESGNVDADAKSVSIDSDIESESVNLETESKNVDLRSESGSPDLSTEHEEADFDKGGEDAAKEEIDVKEGTESDGLPSLGEVKDEKSEDELKEDSVDQLLLECFKSPKREVAETPTLLPFIEIPNNVKYKRGVRLNQIGVCTDRTTKFWTNDEHNVALASFTSRYRQYMDNLKCLVSGTTIDADLKEIQEDFLLRQAEIKKRMYMDYLGSRPNVDNRSMDLMEYMVKKNVAENPKRLDPNIFLYKNFNWNPSEHEPTRRNNDFKKSHFKRFHEAKSDSRNPELFRKNLAEALDVVAAKMKRDLRG